jgi:hypothetical protein
MGVLAMYSYHRYRFNVLVLLSKYTAITIIIININYCNYNLFTECECHPTSNEAESPDRGNRAILLLFGQHQSVQGATKQSDTSSKELR